MKKTVDTGIGGYSFTFNEDAYARLEVFLEMYKNRLDTNEPAEIMNDIERRIAEVFKAEVNLNNQVVTLEMVERIINQMGMPDGSLEKVKYTMETKKKLYRDSDDKKIAGVCGGLAAFFDMDVNILRIIFLIALFFGTCGFWVYLAVWIVAPVAKTPAQKCELRGLELTPENLAKFTETR